MLDPVGLDHVFCVSGPFHCVCVCVDDVLCVSGRCVVCDWIMC